VSSALWKVGSPTRQGLYRRVSKHQTMTQTKFTIVALAVGFTIAALIVLLAVSMGAVAGG
jgi:hypothetical protein